MSSIGSSLAVIALGAILAFAVRVETTGIDIQIVGVILMVVGLIGLAYGTYRYYLARRRASSTNTIDTIE
jgi:uncharacterized membrane protein YidH (DUF202 family)